MSTSGLDAAKIEFNQEERTANVHRMDSLNLLIFTTLLVVVVLTIWMFKRRNFRYLHETCVALIYGERAKERRSDKHHTCLRRFHHRCCSPIHNDTSEEDGYDTSERHVDVEECHSQLDLIRVRIDSKGRRETKSNII